jgi:hypothetical protein
VGARGRLNMGSGNWVPYLGAGIIHAFGTLGQTVELSDADTVNLELLPTQFVQAVFGVVEFVISGG